MSTAALINAAQTVDVRDECASLAAVRSALRLGEGDPHLRLQHVTLFVLDPERSVRFYVERLGFSVIADINTLDGARLVTVAPPDGTASLMLFCPKPDSEHYRRIGQASHIVLLTEDVHYKYQEWSERGVVFHHPPTETAWGGLFTTFEDPDGNSFVLVAFDQATRELEQLRRRTAQAQERERRAQYELELAREVQRKLLPQNQPPLATLDYGGLSVPARVVGGDYYDFLELAPGHLGLVLADISGKGFPAALLMENLQAILRNQFRLCTQDLPAAL
jgi:phosphoserine phosphatase RsbU/P